MARILAATVALALVAARLSAAEAPSKTSAPAVKKTARAAAGTAFKTEDERTFYAYGYRVGQNLAATAPSEAEAQAISQGLRDAITGKREAVSMSIYLPKVGDMAIKRLTAKAEAVKAQGKAYAERFAKEPGVKPIPTGGFIQTLTEGSGAAPAADDTVKVNYRGTLIGGVEFDSSYKRGAPATFPLKNVIPCWTNGAAMMKVGGKAKLVCPSDAAYGDQGHPPVIPGGATLVFEIELLDIVKPAAGVKN